VGGQLSRGTRHRTVELKARVRNLGDVRGRLAELGAEPAGTFRQVDVYFEVPKGRLKLREVKGEEGGGVELVYYEREDVTGPRECHAFVLGIREPARFKGLLERVLKTGAVVKKVREIYRHQGTQIHLDRVKGLGAFVELERETPASHRAIREGRFELERLMEALGISPQSLEELSYGDLVRRAPERGS